MDKEYRDYAMKMDDRAFWMWIAKWLSRERALEIISNIPDKELEIELGKINRFLEKEKKQMFSISKLNDGLEYDWSKDSDEHLVYGILKIFVSAMEDRLIRRIKPSNKDEM